MSIIAEIIMARRGGTGRAMYYRRGTRGERPEEAAVS